VHFESAERNDSNKYTSDYGITNGVTNHDWLLLYIHCDAIAEFSAAQVKALLDVLLASSVCSVCHEYF